MDDATNGEGSETYETDDNFDESFWKFNSRTKFALRQTLNESQTSDQIPARVMDTG